MSLTLSTTPEQIASNLVPDRQLRGAVRVWYRYEEPDRRDLGAFAGGTVNGSPHPEASKIESVPASSKRVHECHLSELYVCTKCSNMRHWSSVIEQVDFFVCPHCCEVLTNPQSLDQHYCCRKCFRCPRCDQVLVYRWEELLPDMVSADAVPKHRRSPSEVPDLFFWGSPDSDGAISDARKAAPNRDSEDPEHTGRTSACSLYCTYCHWSAQRSLANGMRPCFSPESLAEQILNGHFNGPGALRMAAICRALEANSLFDRGASLKTQSPPCPLSGTTTMLPTKAWFEAVERRQANLPFQVKGGPKAESIFSGLERPTAEPTAVAAPLKHLVRKAEVALLSTSGFSATLQEPGRALEDHKAKIAASFSAWHTVLPGLGDYAAPITEVCSERYSCSSKLGSGAPARSLSVYATAASQVAARVPLSEALNPDAMANLKQALDLQAEATQGTAQNVLSLGQRCQLSMIYGPLAPWAKAMDLLPLPQMLLARGSKRCPVCNTLLVCAKMTAATSFRLDYSAVRICPQIMLLRVTNSVKDGSPDSTEATKPETKKCMTSSQLAELRDAYQLSHFSQLSLHHRFPRLCANGFYNVEFEITNLMEGLTPANLKFEFFTAPPPHGDTLMILEEPFETTLACFTDELSIGDSTEPSNSPESHTPSTSLIKPTTEGLLEAEMTDRTSSPAIVSIDRQRLTLRFRLKPCVDRNMPYQGTPAKCSFILHYTVPRLVSLKICPVLCLGMFTDF